VALAEAYASGECATDSYPTVGPRTSATPKSSARGCWSARKPKL